VTLLSCQGMKCFTMVRDRTHNSTDSTYLTTNIFTLTSACGMVANLP
jgi:hypothetical protein